MKSALLHALVYAIELPIILCVVVVFLLWALVHWIDDEWISE